MRTSFRRGMLAALTLAVGIMAPLLATAAGPVTLTHIHGLSYSADGKQIAIPSHHGLALYADGKWSKGAGPEHDYMGYSATRDAIYSSGHPAPGSGLPNPFGLIRSRDGGKTWDQLGLQGESDFHVLATSYGTSAVYVLNHQPNSRMKTAGLYFTLSDGMKWEQAAARGLPAKTGGLAVHPTDAKQVAAAAEEGLFLSRDSGASFAPLVKGRVLAASFDLDGKHLWFSGHEGTPTLARVGLQAGAKPESIPLPAMKQDAVAYIAQNPVRPDEMAIATFNRSVYLSSDRGAHWRQIASDGVGRE